MKMSGYPQRWIQSNVNAIIANSPLTPVFKKNPGLEKVFRDNYEYLKPFLQGERLKKSILNNPNILKNVLKSHGLITPKLLENQPSTREGGVSVVAPVAALTNANRNEAPSRAGNGTVAPIISAIATQPKISHTIQRIVELRSRNDNTMYIQSTQIPKNIYKVIKTGDTTRFLKLGEDSTGKHIWTVPVDITTFNESELFKIINCPETPSMAGGARKSRRQRKQKRKATRKQRK